MILVVDDDRDVLDLLAEALEQEGFAVSTAENGAQALQELQSSLSDHHVCLILLDLMMPIMSGFQFLAQQQRSPDLCEIPVAVMSARWEAKESLQGVEFLPKPMSLDTLLSVVERYCGGS